MNDERQPQLSVILATPDSYATLSRTIRHLRAQECAAELELVIIAPRTDALGEPPESLDDFHSTQVVEAGPNETVSAYRALGVLAAKAPIVVIGEDHSSPQPGWAQALIEAHREYSHCAAIGPVFLNANPHSAMSWAQLFSTYGAYVYPAEGGESNDLAGHNSSYKRDLLLPYGDELKTWLEAESYLHRDLQRRGYKVRVEINARTSHINITKLSAVLGDHANYGRLFSARRAQGWTKARRRAAALRVFCTAPLQLWWAIREWNQPGRREYCSLAELLPNFLLIIAARCWGDWQGYTRGAGQSATRLWRYEFHREHQLNARDLEHIQSESPCLETTPVHRS